MSILCSSSSSTRGTIISKLTSSHMFCFLYPTELTHRIISEKQPRGQERSLTVAPSSIGIEAWFLRSLLSVSHCAKHRSTLKPSAPSFPSPQLDISSRSRRSRPVSFRRLQHTSAAVAGGKEEAGKGALARSIDDEIPDTIRGPGLSREAALALVDQYDDGPSIKWNRSRYQPGDGPYLTVSDNPGDEWPPPGQTWPADGTTRQTIRLLVRALHDRSRDIEEIFEIYNALPQPRVPYLEAQIRHRLLWRLSIVEKNERSMLRYFSVVTDMKVTAIPLSQSEWNSAISFAARYVKHSTEVEVEAALQIWKEMEHRAGIQGNEATFNILFDVASKAGRFTLAEMIYKEMLDRGLGFDRFHHVSLIHLHGLKGDGDGARAAYRSLVEAGEMVDTVVLNAMISALVHSHEGHAAENIYERMKQLHIGGDGGLPPRGWRGDREVTKSLKLMAHVGRQDPDKRDELQKKVILAPDLHTYKILLRHFAVETGDLDKASKLLDELKWFKIPLHEAFFVIIFKGFALHGGIRYTQWTEARLGSVWNALNQALGRHRELEHVHVTRELAKWILRAFAKCAGHSRTLEVWEILKRKWAAGEADLDATFQVLRPLLEAEDMATRQSDWLLGSKEK